MCLLTQGAPPHTSVHTLRISVQRYYVPIPLRMLADLRDNPLAVATYALIARIYRLTRGPVPLSPADLSILDPSLTGGAGTRALKRLRDSGYIVTSPSGGRKYAYTPTWGRINAQPLPWDLAAPCLGRPRHIPEVRLPQELLDICLGRLTPHANHGASVSRYVSSPLISLRDLGAYALAAAGLPAVSHNLRSLGLLRDGHIQPVPPAATILAVASQRAWTDPSQPGLTEAGWEQTTFSGVQEQPPTSSSLLFVVPRERIGHRIGDGIEQQIGMIIPVAVPDLAPQCAAKCSTDSIAGSHGSEQLIDQTTTIGGGDRYAQEPRAASPRQDNVVSSCSQLNALPNPHTPDRRPIPQRSPAAQLSPAACSLSAPAEEQSEGLRQLLNAGVNARVARELALGPETAIRQAIRLARSTPGVRDQARWVVGVLRDWQARGWPTAALSPASASKVSDTPILMHSGISGHERQIWLGRFRSADPADRPAVLARFHQEVVHAASS